MKILVTGADGFIGRNLVNRIKDLHTVTGLCRKDSITLDIPVLFGDLKYPDRIPSLKNYDVIINCAGRLGNTAPDNEIEDSNFIAVRNLLSRSKGKKIIHISSAGVYGPGLDMDEKKAYNPTNIYEISKLKSDLLVQRHEDFVILRPEFVYGPHDLHCLPLFRQIKRGKPFINGKGENLWHPTYIDDMTQAIVNSLNSKRTVLNVAGSTIISVNEFYGKVKSFLGVSECDIHVPEFAARTYSTITSGIPFLPRLHRTTIDFFTNDRTISTEKARNEIGFKPISLDVGLKRTISWYKRNGYL